MQRRAVLRLGLGAAAAGALGKSAVCHAQGVQSGLLPLQLLRTGDIGGLPVVEIALGGRPTRWLVDSGATTALIAPALAATLGLSRLPPVRVATAGGAQTRERFALPDLPVLGAPGAGSPAVAVDLDAVLGEAGGALDGLLGAPWLRTVATRFDFAGGELRWSATAEPAANAAVLPLRWDGGLPVASLELGARPAEGFLFDTGNAGALVVFARRARALLDDAGMLPEMTLRELGGSVRVRYARIDRLGAAGWRARDVPAALEAGANARRGAHFDRLAGSLGNALFESGAVTLDGPGSRLIVELPGLPEPAPLPGGFGLVLTRRSGSALAIGAVIEGGPAATAGVGPGDAVLAIDGNDVRTATPAQAWQMLAKREAATFELASGDAPPRRVRLQRERFFPPLR